MKLLIQALLALVSFGMASAPAAAAPNAAPATASTAPSQAADSKDSADEEPDTIILSDTLHYDDAKKTSTFTGKVIVTRGSMTLHADKLVTHENEAGDQHGTATAAPGNIVTIRKSNPEKFEVLIGTGLQADYEGTSGDIILTGMATMTRQICGKAFDNVRGSKIIYHDKTETYEAEGGKQSAAPDGRVRSLIQPQSRIDRAIAQCKAQNAS